MNLRGWMTALGLGTAAVAGYTLQGDRDADKAVPNPKPISAGAGQFDPRNPEVELQTTLGTIVVRLYLEKAPLTVGNFLTHVERGFYNGTIIHEIHPNFIAIAGGYQTDLREKLTGAPIPCEANNGLTNKRYTVAMARMLNAADSGTTHFFFNLNNNAQLDHRGQAPDQYGFCVFGEVIRGMEIVDQLNLQPVDRRGNFIALPQAEIAIQRARRIR